jgi:hypothetical protein
MGLGSSTPEKSNAKENVQKLFDIDVDNEYLESLNISELHTGENKIALPIIGGQNYNEGNITQYNDDDDNLNVDFNLAGGGNNDVRFMARRRRYLRHNIFKILSDLDGHKGGGNALNGVEDDKYLTTSSDDEAIKNIKEIILKEVNKLNSTSAQSGGGCGCDGNKDDSDQDGGAKKRRNTKSKSKSKKQKGGDTRQKKQVEKDSSSDTSSSSSSSSSSSDKASEKSYNAKRTNKKVNIQKSESSLNDEDDSDDDSSDNSEDNSSNDKSSESQLGGLSIFPFNSSEVKSSISEKKNMRMIRRKI